MSKLEILTRKLSFVHIGSNNNNNSSKAIKSTNNSKKSKAKDDDLHNSNSCSSKASSFGAATITQTCNNNLPNKVENESSTTATCCMNGLDPNFEYKGYHKFSRILGKGSFGTVIECERKQDNKLIAIKFFKYKAIHKWINESLLLSNEENLLSENLMTNSEFFSKENINRNQSRMLPLEVACLLKSNKLDGVIKIVDYIPVTQQNNLGLTNQNEVTISNDHPNELIDENSIIGIVLERNSNEMCLFDYLIQSDHLDEDEARFIFKQIVETSLQLLQIGILHGDLKSENILIDPKTKRIKLIDFGSAQFLDASLASNTASTNSNQKPLMTFHKCNSQSLMTKPVRTFRGTNLYKPPEFLLHHCFYPRPSTVWTFGIILYDMVCGRFPFDNDSDVLTHQDREVMFMRTGLTDDFKDLVKRCLAFYVADRIVIEKILAHPWMVNKH